MKINDLLNENDLDEAPAGALGQAARKIGSAVADKLGMQNAAGKMATKADVGDEANRIKRELNQFMSGAGIKKNQLELNDLVDFLQKAGFDKNSVVQTVRKIVPKKPVATPKPNPATLTASLDNSVTEAVAPQVIDKVIMSLVQQGFKQQAPGQQQRSKYATDGGAPAAAGNNKAVAQAMNKFKSTTGIKSPAIAAKALQKAGNGEVLAPNERKEIAPLLGKLAQAMNDQGGQQRILQLFRQAK